MGRRTALLIGAENYGDGFAPLPAVRQDIQLISSALAASGYEVELCPENVLADAGRLDDVMRQFCSAGGPDDVHILYFTGHGLLADGEDCIVPAGTDRKRATISSNQRVSTDLSKTVADSKTGLVLFIIDACRDKQDALATKGGAGWGDPARLERPGEARFIRLFGCAANQVCQVLRSKSGEASLFTKALTESILKDNCASLSDLLSQVTERCAGLLSEDPLLQSQTPHLSYGEISDKKQDILHKTIFGLTVQAGLTSVWPSFDPGKLHCLVVVSESGPESSPDWGLEDLVQDALTGETGQRIWTAFLSACNHRKLVSGRRRDLPEAFTASVVSFSSFSVLDALASAESLDKAARVVVEADVVVFDVTGFEPGVMLLIGIRSACCRWLSVCSHGGGWDEGQTLEIPFNLQDLNISSHTPRETEVGADPAVERLVRRIEKGFEQLSRHPRYLDLPAYDALRELGSDYSACSTIDVKERILVLCSYGKEFSPKWKLIRSRLKTLLWQKNNYSPAIERIIDHGTPQLIWQNLYEYIRRTAACVVDWSGYRASVFLELGVRLAVSEWGAVQICDEVYLPGGPKALKLEQIERLQHLFEPIGYRSDTPAAFEKTTKALVERAPHLDGEAAYNRIHRVLLPILGEIQEAHPPMAEDLKRRADALHHPKQGRLAAPQILFHGSRATKQDSEKAALELRIAAWLYLEHRVRPEKIKEDLALLELYGALGRSAADALYDLGDDESIELAGHIEDRLKQMGREHAGSAEGSEGQAGTGDLGSQKG